MIKSMTGYGSARGASGRIEISVEVKSVNNRYLDCSVKMPRVFISFEKALKTLVQNRISRGKVDVFLSIDSSNADDIAVSVNKPLAEAYISTLRDMARQYGLICDISAMDIAQFNEVISVEKKEADPDMLCNDICGVLGLALDQFDEMRVREGEKMSGDIKARLEVIKRQISEVERISPRSVAAYREKLEARLNELLQKHEIEEPRIMLEAAIFADRISIDEETVRLRSHASQLEKALEGGEPVGRKIDFLLQEFNREVNTIGSKGNDAEMAKIIVDLKSEIEKIREQAQNIE